MESNVKNKATLKLIAKRWAKGILKATAIDCDTADELLSTDEQSYIIEQVNKIADKIIEENQNNSLDDIISEYFELED